MSDSPIVIHEICPTCVLPAEFDESEDVRTCHVCELSSIRGLWRSVPESGAATVEGRVRHYRSGSKGRLSHAPYRGHLHDAADRCIDIREELDKALWYLPEGAEVEIEVRWRWSAAGPPDEDDYWTLLKPHKYGHAREAEAAADDKD